MWLGASDIQSEGTYVWESSNVPFSFTKWNPNEPDGLDGENCLVSWIRDGWDDFPCESSSTVSLCETLYNCNLTFV